MIGGPNGAGKTTAAGVLLPETLRLPEFVNADNIALGLSPFNAGGVAVAAGRVMLARMDELRRAGTSFAFETTCAGKGHARFLRDCQSEGWQVTLLFFFLDHPDLAVRRVAQRVRQGGHNIPPDVIARRYRAGLRNLMTLYLPLADTAEIFDNTLGAAVPVARKAQSGELIIRDEARWTRLKEAVDGRDDG